MKCLLFYICAHTCKVPIKEMMDVAEKKLEPWQPQQDELIAKVHSVDGEYLQCGDQVFSEIEEERIIYLEAFCYLLHHCLVLPSSESKEMSLYSLAAKAALKEAI